MAKRDDVPGMAAKLKIARENAGLSQVSAADAAGVPRENISKFEAGTKTPTVATLLRLADAYGVSVADLVPQSKKEATPPDETSPPPPKKGPKK